MDLETKLAETQREVVEGNQHFCMCVYYMNVGVCICCDVYALCLQDHHGSHGLLVIGSPDLLRSLH